MKTAILNKLTRSANERKTFECIWDLTRGRGKRQCIITNDEFSAHGLPDRSNRDKAIKRLLSKGVINRVKCDQWWRMGDGVTFIYAVKEWGCLRFLYLHASGCLACKKKVRVA